jgi:hypothetical protein
VHGKAAWARRKFLLLYAAIAMTQFAVVLATLAALSEAILA